MLELELAARRGAGGVGRELQPKRVQVLDGRDVGPAAILERLGFCAIWSWRWQIQNRCMGYAEVHTIGLRYLLLGAGNANVLWVAASGTG